MLYGESTFYALEHAYYLLLAAILRKGDRMLEEKIFNICRGSDEEIREWLHSMVPSYTNGHGETMGQAIRYRENISSGA